MTRKSIFILGLGVALAFPAAASANCGTLQGSYVVTCEQGVQVYRHNALSGVPAPLTQGEVALQIEESRAKTARAQIAAQSRANQRNAELRNRELAIQDFEARTINQTLRAEPFAFSNRFGNGIGFGNTGFRSGVSGRRGGQGVRSRSRFVSRGF